MSRENGLLGSLKIRTAFFSKVVYFFHREPLSSRVIFFSQCLSINSSKLKDIIVAKFTFQEITWNQRKATSFSPHLSPVIALVILGSIITNSASILSFLLEPARAGQRKPFYAATAFVLLPSCSYVQKESCLVSGWTLLFYF